MEFQTCYSVPYNTEDPESLVSILLVKKCLSVPTSLSVVVIAMLLKSQTSISSKGRLLGLQQSWILPLHLESNLIGKGKRIQVHDKGKRPLIYPFHKF